MKSLANNSNLSAAKKAKNDEFYTQYRDIEKELGAYLDYDPDVFRGKTVLLPCDDPEWSNFTKYFAAAFNLLGIKKMISTSYNPNGQGKVFILCRDTNQDGVINFEDLEWEYLQGNGDFRSDEVKALRDESDIIVTNPPFSLFREFLAWIMEADKKFAIIGNMNAITYKEVFPLIKDNKIWLGRGRDKGGNSMWFTLPKDAPTQKHEKLEDGKRLIPVSSKWFTNLEHGRRHQPMEFMTMADNLRFNKEVINNPKTYVQYDHYQAIEVPRTSAIPSDYDGVMGVPISFLDKYCPKQFEIVGMAEDNGKGHSGGVWLGGNPHCVVLGQNAFKRLFIKHKNPLKPTSE